MNKTSSAMPLSTPKPQAVAVAVPRKALEIMAERLQVDAGKLYNMLKNTVFKGATDEEFMTLVAVSNRYNLDPLVKQLYAFPDRKRGGIVPIVPIDGWAAIVNSQNQFDGAEFEFTWQDEKKRTPESCTCLIYMKNRSHPMKVTEYYSECWRDTEPWKNMPCRMLRHKALMQCARYAFSVGGIYDEDEARDIINITSTTVGAPPPSFLGPGDAETTQREVTTPAKDDDAPPGAEMPKNETKPTQSETKAPPVETREAPDETNEPANETPPDQPEASPFQNFDPSAADILKGDQLLEAVVTTLKRSGCTNEQFTAWARKSVLCGPEQVWTDMPSRRGGEASLRAVLRKWSSIGPNVKATQVE